MRRIIALLVAIIISVNVPNTRVVAASSRSQLAHRAVVRPPIVPSPLPDRSVIDRLVFETPLSEFRRERSRARRLNRWLITASDGCTAPVVGSRGKSFDFRLACERHDLAYANYASLSRLGLGVTWDASLRARVDDQFQRDLQQSCVSRRHSERLRCDSWVVVFFHAVRVAAGP